MQGFVWANNTRIIAIFAVVLLHVSARIVIDAPIGSGDWWIGNLYNSAVRWCVPVFVMLSGALLLSPEKTEPTRTFYTKRASRILIPLLFWSVAFSGWTALKQAIKGEPADILALGKGILSGLPYFHLWFLYMLLGLYFIAPYLRTLVRNTPRRDLYLLVLVGLAISSACKWHEITFARGNGMFVVWFLTYTPYFILGHLLATTRKIGLWPLLAVLVLSTALTAVGHSYLVQALGPLKGKYLYSYVSLTVIPQSISVMILLKHLNRAHPLTARTAGMVLGIYLVHPIIIELLALGGVTAAAFNGVVSIPVLSLAVFAMSASACWVISRVPWLRRTI